MCNYSLFIDVTTCILLKTFWQLLEKTNLKLLHFTEGMNLKNHGDMGKVQSLGQSSSSTAQHTVKAASHQEDFSFL